MATLLANIGNTAIANVLQIIYRSHPEATIGFQGQNIVIRLCYLHVTFKYRRKLLKNANMATLLANIGNTAISNVLQIIYRHDPEATLGFKVKV